eukprot:TRINITY_DN9589_c0_g1_i1.p1 TRINITY_DN9589_c0_g1~~TRINITY_DN9589_c0_g1_i1.p1  ORF type:complete len:110 (+),score=35.33 TRINITY_DN9589_c0_g1_i1:29-331(+)
MNASAIQKLSGLLRLIQDEPEILYTEQLPFLTFLRSFGADKIPSADSYKGQFNSRIDLSASEMAQLEGFLAKIGGDVAALKAPEYRVVREFVEFFGGKIE